MRGLLAIAVAAWTACTPATTGAGPAIGTSRAPRPERDAATEPAVETADAAPEAAPEPIVTLAPCMTAADAVAWATGPGADTVAAALARFLTDLTPASAPEVSPASAAASMRSIEASTLADPACASLLVAYAAGGSGEGIALFAPALTAPDVAFAFCADGVTACAILRSDDVDGDGAGDLLVERTRPGTAEPASQALYAFRPDADPFPVWISDDDAVRRALFGRDDDADPSFQAEIGEVAFAFEGGTPTIRADYRTLSCALDAAGLPSSCEPTGAETLEFTRLGDVYLLPGEPEPGAPWGRPGADDSDR